MTTIMEIAVCSIGLLGAAGSGVLWIKWVKLTEETRESIDALELKETEIHRLIIAGYILLTLMLLGLLGGLLAFLLDWISWH